MAWNKGKDQKIIQNIAVSSDMPWIFSTAFRFIQILPSLHCFTSSLPASSSSGMICAGAPSPKTATCKARCILIPGAISNKALRLSMEPQPQIGSKALCPNVSPWWGLHLAFCWGRFEEKKSWKVGDDGRNPEASSPSFQLWSNTAN